MERIRPTSSANIPEKDPSNSLKAWKGVLDAMEEQLNAGEAFIESLNAATNEDPEELGVDQELLGEQQEPNFGFSPPTDIGPVPAELVDRARAVLQRQHDLEAATQAAMNTARKHSDAAKAMRPAAPSVPVYFDGSL